MSIFAEHTKVLYATSTKADGDMSLAFGDKKEVLHHRKTFLKKQGLLLEDCVVMQVEHEDTIVVVDTKDALKKKGEDHVISAEALITKTKNLNLFLLTADCLPIAFFDPKKKVIGLAHLGWRPSERSLVLKIIKTFVKKFGSHPKDILVSIGPGIHKESYAFENPIQKTLPNWALYLHDLPSGGTQIDLVGYNKAELLEAGVLEEHIEVDPTDTGVSKGYFSHYRALRTGEVEGRFATILSLLS